MSLLTLDDWALERAQSLYIFLRRNILDRNNYFYAIIFAFGQILFWILSSTQSLTIFWFGLYLILETPVMLQLFELSSRTNIDRSTNTFLQIRRLLIWRLYRVLSCIFIACLIGVNTLEFCFNHDIYWYLCNMLFLGFYPVQEYFSALDPDVGERKKQPQKLKESFTLT